MVSSRDKNDPGLPGEAGEEGKGTVGAEASLPAFSLPSSKFSSFSKLCDRGSDTVRKRRGGGCGRTRGTVMEQRDGRRVYWHEKNERGEERKEGETRS